jgi:hypothetical protein
MAAVIMVSEELLFSFETAFIARKSTIMNFRNSASSTHIVLYNYLLSDSQCQAVKLSEVVR